MIGICSRMKTFRAVRGDRAIKMGRSLAQQQTQISRRAIADAPSNRPCLHHDGRCEMLALHHCTVRLAGDRLHWFRCADRQKAYAAIKSKRQTNRRQSLVAAAHGKVRTGPMRIANQSKWTRDFMLHEKLRLVPAVAVGVRRALTLNTFAPSCKSYRDSDPVRPAGRIVAAGLPLNVASKAPE